MSKPKIRILIVDDDQVDRMACRRALSKSEHSNEFVVSEAETAREGLQLAHSQKPDCVLLDYHLPDLNGLEFLAELRDDLGELTVPVMMLTGSDNVSVAVEAMKSGAHDYLIKDTSRQYLELLPAVIQRVLRERRAVTEKKQMEARMGEVEAQYRFLVEQIPAITYTASLDTPGKLLYVSPQLNALGYSPEDWINQIGALRSHVHPDDQARAVDPLDRVRVAGKPLRCEYRLFNSAGEIRWFLDEATLVRDDSGEPMFLQGILVDITEDKQVEEELRMHRHYVGDIVTMRTSQLEKQASVLTSANANLSGIIQEMKQSERLLKKYSNRLADLYDNAPCGYHSLDADGVFVQINDTELKWHALTREKVIGKIKFSDLLAPASVKTFQESFEQFKGSGWIRNLELEIERTDGTHLTVLLNASAILDTDGKFVMSRSILVDISDLKHAGQAA
jgi:PAS domain S-box-containing protein